MNMLKIRVLQIVLQLFAVVRLRKMWLRMAVVVAGVATLNTSCSGNASDSKKTTDTIVNDDSMMVTCYEPMLITDTVPDSIVGKTVDNQ